jgi:hypothetical protein
MTRKAEPAPAEKASERVDVVPAVAARVCALLETLAEVAALIRRFDERERKAAKTDCEDS